MRNREKYILKCDEYDLMMGIKRRLESKWQYCPISILGAERPPCKTIPDPDYKYKSKLDCESCVQKWLNEEAK